MNIKKCKNGHFYDENRYNKCPHCLSVGIDKSMNIPEKYRKLGPLVCLDRGSTCRVYKINAEVPLVLKVINCDSDDKYNNALYEKLVMDTLEQSDKAVSVLDFEVVESQNGKRIVYILEEYHISLEQFVSINDFSKKQMLRIAIELCTAVQEIIARGVFHLDLKPKNIFIADENKVIIGDFGSSLLAGDLKNNKSMRGTLEYMAPEVYQERNCSERSEIYSIGLIIYYLLNEQKLPFVKDANDSKQREIATYKRLAGTEFPVLYVNSLIDDEINSLIQDVCSYKKESRVKSISDLKSRLVKILGQMDDSDEFAANSTLAPKRVLPIIFMIDASGSMNVERIAVLNELMHDIFDLLLERAGEYVDSEIRLSVLKYSTCCEWITKGLVKVGDFQWENLITRGVTNFGVAIKELDSKLSRTAFFSGTSEYCVPFIINITDGIPTDDWERELELARKNKWFSLSKKICITIGDDTDFNMLEKFCGTKELIFRANDISALRNCIIDISVSASRLSGFSLPSVTEWNERSLTAEPISTTMALQPQCINDDNSEWGDGDWNVDPFATSVMISGNNVNNAEQRRLLLAEALRSGQNVIINADGSVATDFDIDDSKDFKGIVVPDGKLAGGTPIHCRVCENAVFSGAKFCPYCGNKITNEKPVVQLSQVEFSAVAPKQLVKGEYSIIDVIMYEESYRYIVDEIHRQSDSETQENRSGKIKVQEESNIKIVLHSNDIDIEDNELTGVWQGAYLSFSFPVYLPENYKKRQILLIAKVFINDIIATRLMFTVRCSSLFEHKIKIHREDVLSAFISYASQDRKKVATIVQGMQKARPDMDLFFDVESLRSGDDWEKTLLCEIEKRDVLYLCWSHHAKNSEWVDKEWRYAYSQKGIDGIEPIPIELPEDCPPPQELSGKHWNDKLLYLIGHFNKVTSEEKTQRAESEWGDSWS